jgi:hypothetical protein
LLTLFFFETTFFSSIMSQYSKQSQQYANEAEDPGAEEDYNAVDDDGDEEFYGANDDAENDGAAPTHPPTGNPEQEPETSFDGENRYGVPIRSPTSSTGGMISPTPSSRQGEEDDEPEVGSYPSQSTQNPLSQRMRQGGSQPTYGERPSSVGSAPGAMEGGTEEYDPYRQDLTKSGATRGSKFRADIQDYKSADQNAKEAADEYTNSKASYPKMSKKQRANSLVPVGGDPATTAEGHEDLSKKSAQAAKMQSE